MMRRARHRAARHGRARRDERGATLVEFVLVAPLLFLLLFGIIAGCFLMYQKSALHDGATAAARTASIESSLLVQNPNTGLYCESAKPYSIEKTVSQAAPLLPVNRAPLCATSSSATELTQTPTVPGDVNITLTCGGSCSAPSTMEVALQFTTKGLLAPFGLTYTLTASSQVPVASP
jgi:Flp pilus assembly protein TadG